MNKAKSAWAIINVLQKSMTDGEDSLKVVPLAVIKIVNGELWREVYCEPTKQTVCFKSFAEFVCASLPEGLGADIRTLKHLCMDNPEALDAIDRATANPAGTNQHVDNVNNLEERPDGNSRDAALRRLRKDRPDLHAKVLAKEVSPNAAMVTAGFRHPTVTVRKDDALSAVRTLLKYYSRVDLESALNTTTE